MTDEVYSYQIDGTLADPNGQTTSIDGSFQVDYTTGTVSNVNISGFNVGYLSSSAKPDGTTEYDVTLRYFPQGPYVINYANISYNTPFPPYADNVSETEGTNPNPYGVQPGSDTYSAERVQMASRLISICFATGTRIGTKRGAVPVEQLRLDDLALTAEGSCRPIHWIGSRTLEHPSDEQCPVRIRAGAFGTDLPARDLFLSPGHPVLVGANADNEGGQLVPIMCLINGTTIERHPVAAVTYWHVELDQHDILLADGLPAESYIDLGSRPWFADEDGVLFDPDLVLPGTPGRCRPVALDGPVVEAERRRLDHVFAASLASQCGWTNDEGTTLPRP